MIPLGSFVAHSADGKLVPVVPGGHNLPLTFSNRAEYVERALEYRLHEMDRQVTLPSHIAQENDEQHATLLPHTLYTESHSR